MSFEPLTKTHPSIASNWHPRKNGDVLVSQIVWRDRRQFWWRCEQGHEYRVSVFTRVRTNGCKFCHKDAHAEKIRLSKLKAENSLAVRRPDLLAEWQADKNRFDPAQVSVGSHLRIWWKCAKGHEWLAPVKVRAITGHGCRACALESQSDRARQARFQKSGKNLFSAYPNLESEWDYERNHINPNILLPQSNVKAHWKCRFGHLWQANV